MSRRLPRSCLPILFPIAAFACSSSSPQAVSSPPAAASAVSTPDGSSLERAIVVPRDTEKEGIAWEYAWIRDHVGEYRRKTQRLLMSGERRFDQITVTLADGTDRTFYFDITRYFGRF